MNMGLVTGLIVGGLLMLSVIALNVRVSQSAGQKTFQYMSKTKVHTVAEMISTDMRRVGAGIKGNNSVKVLGTPSPTQIEFKMVGEQSNQELTITWKWDKTSAGLVTTSSNPNDYRLTRRVVTRTTVGTVVTTTESTTDYGTGIVDFKLTYYDLAGIKLPASLGSTDIANLRRIEVDMIVESDEKYGEDYNRSYWTELFTPRSIQRTGAV